jgi:type IV pilus assembly protein PilM
MTERKIAVRLPHLACEVTAQGVAAVRSEGKLGTIGAMHSRALATGVLTPALNAQNVQDAKTLSDAIQEALSTVGGHGQDVIAVLPDSAVRVTLLDFDSLPERRQEADAAVRFRLRKSLPFDIEKAALSFDAQQTPQGLHVAASIVLRSVLEEYESAFRAAGCSPSVVLPSSLGALGAVDGEVPTMLLKIGLDATSVAVVKDGQLLLFRVLEGTGTGTLTAERMADDIYPSLVYFQDNYGASVEKLLVSGVSNLDEFSPALEAQTGVNARELIGSGVVAGNLRNDFAGAIGALL